MGFQKAATVKQKTGITIDTVKLPGAFVKIDGNVLSICSHPTNCHTLYMYCLPYQTYCVKDTMIKLVRKVLQVALVDEFAHVQVCLTNEQVNSKTGEVLRECGFKQLGEPYFNHRYEKLQERNSYIKANRNDPNDKHWITTWIANVFKVCPQLDITEDKV